MTRHRVQALGRAAADLIASAPAEDRTHLVGLVVGELAVNAGLSALQSLGVYVGGVRMAASLAGITREQVHAGIDAAFGPTHAEAVDRLTDAVHEVSTGTPSIDRLRTLSESLFALADQLRGRRSDTVEVQLDAPLASITKAEAAARVSAELKKARGD